MAFTLIEKLYFKTEFAHDHEQTVGLAATFCNKFLVYTVCTSVLLTYLRYVDTTDKKESIEHTFI